MGGHLSLRLRMAADVAMVVGFGLLAPVALSPIGRNWQTLATAFAAYFLAVGFMLDFLQNLRRFRKLRSR
jgi:hypothetical protein